ncbi:hypothetical protein AAFF_G00058410 [Aldrovandia affinis]|uniref:Uncharacterized protein n=1 Tax=Aldrovandia affinis TaxID=143900 RepID=A0AAD7S0M7_9TELE|nr:hypothetical protein AAFF_G00058410 [Aldrovandia affinis]
MTHRWWILPSAGMKQVFAFLFDLTSLNRFLHWTAVLRGPEEEVTDIVYSKRQQASRADELLDCAPRSPLSSICNEAAMVAGFISNAIQTQGTITPTALSHRQVYSGLQEGAEGPGKKKDTSPKARRHTQSRSHS